MRASTKLALLAVLSSFVPPAHAQGDIGGALVKQAEQAIINGITTQVGNALGAGSPLLLDQHTAFAQAPDLVNFHPVLLKPTARDLARRLPPGDYAIPVTGYCTQYSIHAPGRGLGYKLARVQGKQASAISALLVQGSLQGVSPYTLNADAWRIQAGVPLRQWSADDQALVHRLIPRHERELQGDFLQQLQATYDDKSVLKFFGMKKRIPGLPSFEVLIGQMGEVGKTVMRLEAARQVLTNKTVSAERLPDMLYEPQGDGLPRVLPPSSDPSPSPWAEVQPGVFARYTILDGNMGRNLYEFRVTPDAARQTRAALDGAAKPRLMTVASGPAPPSTDGPTLGNITGMGDASGEGSSLNIGYSMGQGAQALIAVPILASPNQGGNFPPDNPAPDKPSPALKIVSPQPGPAFDASNADADATTLLLQAQISNGTTTTVDWTFNFTPDAVTQNASSLNLPSLSLSASECVDKAYPLKSNDFANAPAGQLTITAQATVDGVAVTDSVTIGISATLADASQEKPFSEVLDPAFSKETTNEKNKK